MVFRRLLKYPIYVLATTLLFSCGEKRTASWKKPQNSAAEPGQGVASHKNSEPVGSPTDEPIVRKEFLLRDFQQYYTTLQSITGVNPNTDSKEHASIRAAFQNAQLKLAASNDVNLLSAFSVIAMTNLSSRFCAAYIKTGSVLADTKLTQDEFVSKMLSQFMDSDHTQYKGYEETRRALLEIVNSNNGLVQNNSALKLRVVACTAFLSSAYVFLY